MCSLTMKHTRVVSTKCTPGFACRAFSDTTLVCFIVNEHTTKCSHYTPAEPVSSHWSGGHCHHVSNCQTAFCSRCQSLAALRSCDVNFAPAMRKSHRSAKFRPQMRFQNAAAISKRICDFKTHLRPPLRRCEFHIAGAISKRRCSELLCLDNDRL